MRLQRLQFFNNRIYQYFNFMANLLSNFINNFAE